MQSISETLGIADAATAAVGGPCLYYRQDEGGVFVNGPVPSAGGAILNLVYMGPTLGNQWRYSGAVNGTTTLYVTDCGPTIGRKRSPT
jgi:hypothetical protein